MQHFIGTKRVAAIAMTRLSYNEYRGWNLPADENGNDDGYLVEYQDGSGGNHPAHAGYISWSPRAQFEAAYQPISAMSYEHALVAMKAGHRVARAGWNGKGMFVWVEKGSIDAPDFFEQPEEVDVFINGVRLELFTLGDQGTATRMPHFSMRAADGSTVTGWTASQVDALAEDWTIVEAA